MLLSAIQAIVAVMVLGSLNVFPTRPNAVLMAIFAMLGLIAWLARLLAFTFVKLRRQILPKSNRPMLWNTYHSFSVPWHFSEPL
jgi:hypothetical protein